MNSVEKNLVNIENKIKDCEKEEGILFDKYIGVKREREEVETKLVLLDDKILRLNSEYDDLKSKKISLICVPAMGVACFSFALLFSAPVALTAGITILGGACGYRFSNDVVRNKMLNGSDELLLKRVFPSVARKGREVRKAYRTKEHFNDKLEELTLEEESVKSEREDMILEIGKLRKSKDSMVNLIIEKLNRESSHKDMKDILDKVVKDPEHFYRSICWELSNEEKRDLALSMEGKSCENCRNFTCRLTEEEKAKLEDCKAWYNEVEIGMSKVLKR